MRTMDTKRELKPPADRRYVNEMGNVTSLIDPDYVKSYPVEYKMKDGERL